MFQRHHFEEHITHITFSPALNTWQKSYKTYPPRFRLYFVIILFRSLDSEAYTTCLCKRGASTLYHPVGTCTGSL